MEYLIGSGLPSYPAGLTDKDAALVSPLYAAMTTLSQHVSVATGQVKLSAGDMVGLDRFDGVKIQNISKISVIVGEALTYGDLLTLAPAGANLVAMKATNADPAKFAMALCDTVGGLDLGESAQVLFLQGRTRGITGSLFGATYYLGTAGGVVAAPPGGGATVQIVGMGLSGAGFYLNILPRTVV